MRRLGQRTERDVNGIRDRAPAGHYHPGAARPILDLPGEAGLADPCLTGHHHHTAMAGPRGDKARLQGGEVFLAPDDDRAGQQRHGSSIGHG